MHVMLSVTLQVVMFASFIALLVLIWRVSKWPRWRIRAVVYGWAAVFLLAIFWTALMPRCCRNLMDSSTLANTFPDGTIAMAALFGGWFWPLIVVGIANCRDRKTTGNNHAA